MSKLEQIIENIEIDRTPKVEPENEKPKVVIQEDEYNPKHKVIKRVAQTFYCPCTRIFRQYAGMCSSGTRTVRVAETELRRLADQIKKYKDEWKRNYMLVRSGQLTPEDLYEKIRKQYELDLLGHVSTLPYSTVAVEDEHYLDTDNQITTDEPLIKSVVRAVNEKDSKQEMASIPIYEDIDLELSQNTGNTFAIIGSSKKGKTELFKYLYKKYFSGNDYVSTLYTHNPQIINNKKSKYKRLLVHDKFDDIEMSVVRSQKELNKVARDGKLPKYKFFNAFDDLIKVGQTKFLDDMILTYRNARMSSMIMIQYSNLLSKSSRANYNYLMFFGMNTRESVEVVLKSFLASYFIDVYGVYHLEDQIRLYNKLTRDHRFILLDQLKSEISVHKLNLRRSK